MTKARRKKIITIETIQRTVVHQNFNQTSGIRCEFCQAEIEMTRPEIAAKILQISLREVYRRIEKGEVHFIERENDSLLICVNSLKTN